MSQLATVKEEALSKADVKLVVIGCGDYQPIKNYAGESRKAPMQPWHREDRFFCSLTLVQSC